MEKTHTIRIAVINDGTKILPFSMGAKASVFEATYEFGDAGYKLSLKDTGEKHTVEWLIQNQKNHYSADYPFDPEDPILEKERMQELICGKIDDAISNALYEFRMRVIGDVTTNMRHFVQDYEAEELRKEEAEDDTQVRGLSVFRDLLFILSPDCEKLAEYYKRYEISLTDKEKIEFLIEWTEERNNWDYYRTFLPLFNMEIDQWDADTLAHRFLKKFDIVGENRNVDFYSIQSSDLENLKLLKKFVSAEAWGFVIARALMYSVKYRLILFAEYLMDEGADINYEQGDHVSAATYESLILDQTIVKYIEYYREHGKKMDVDVKSFFREECGELIYTPEILGKNYL